MSQPELISVRESDRAPLTIGPEAATACAIPAFTEKVHAFRSMLNCGSIHSFMPAQPLQMVQRAAHWLGQSWRRVA